jgi:hypothetical protein
MQYAEQRHRLLEVKVDPQSLAHRHISPQTSEMRIRVLPFPHRLRRGETMGIGEHTFRMTLPVSES